MNKKALLAIMVLFIVALIFACGGKDSASTDNGGMDKADEPVVLKVMGYADNATGERVSWENALVEFQAMYPNVKLEVETLFDEPFHQKATARVQSGDVPHVAYMWPGSRSAYFKPVNADIRPYIDQNLYLPAAMTSQGPNGELYMLPYGVTSTSVLYVNTAVLDKYGFDIPKTYADLKAMVAPLRADGVDVIAMANKSTWVMNSCLLGTLIGRYAGDGDWFAQAVQGKYAFTDEPFVKSLEMIQTIYADGVLPATSIQTDRGTAASNFINGKAAFFIEGDWAIRNFVDSETSADLPVVADIEMVSFPAVPGEKSNMADSSSVVQATGYGITKAALRDPAVTEAAVNFMNYMGGPEQSLLRFTTTGQIPAYKMDLPQDTTEMIRKKADHVTTIPAVSNVVDNYIGGTPNNNLNENLQKMTLGLMTPQQVAEELERDVRSEQ